MIELGSLQGRLAARGMGGWAARLPQQLAQALGPRRHGDLDGWLEVVARLPRTRPSVLDLGADAPLVGRAGDTDAATRARLEAGLRRLHPWRKGPFRVHGVLVDSEWRSDRKWARLSPHIASLEGRAVLDVGCGNGYYMWRMAGAGAALVVGLDPAQLFLAQFLAIRHFVAAHPVGAADRVHLLPLGVEALPAGLQAFDTVFSMGVLYHRRSPLDHLVALRGALRPGGELVLETLVIEGGAGRVLVPPGRYAKMRNVWFIPSVAELEGWLGRCGFSAVRTLDVSPTTSGEQRSTGWMRFESLADFLDPSDPTRTLEGHPAPRRALLLARA